MSEPQKTPVPVVPQDPDASGSANPSAGPPLVPPPPAISAMSSSAATHSAYPAAPSGLPPSSPYNEPPPSYQAAVNCPTESPYAQPGANPAFPKPFYPNQGAAPYPPQPGSYQGYPDFPPLPQPPQQAQPIIVNVTAVPGEVVLRCAHCGGVMIQSTDFCCLFLLIALCLFTFPIGLIFLCCIPCTTRRRCSSCNRIG